MTDGFPVPGEVFEGRYRISRLIGSGGFARVYSAVQEDLGRDVAIKVLMPATNSDGSHYSEKLVRRFNQEARLVSRLRDPHTITMFDYGETSGGLLYMVFEYIEGRSLSEAVHHDGALEYERVVKVLEATLSSLQEAHAFGVLHRDIKPGNIMLFDYLGRPDQVKLLDFGIAKSLSDKVPGKDITADGALVGTPRYMSPEQIRGQEMGPSSDIYSLGLVAFEMLMGYKVIDSNSSVTIIGKQLDSAPFLVPADADVPDGLKTIVNRMMAKDRNERFQNAEQVLDALSDFKEGKPIDSTDVSEDHFGTRKTVPMPEISVEPIDQTMSPATNASMVEDSSPSQDQSAEPDTRRFAATSGPVSDDQLPNKPGQDFADSSNATRKLAVFAVIALLLIGSTIVAVLATSGSDGSAEETPRTSPDGLAVTGDVETTEADEVAEAKASAELAAQLEDSATTQAAEVEPAEPKPVDLLVATRPVAASISINGKAYGQSPAEIRLVDTDFPVEVVATIDDETVTTTLTDPTSSVVLDVTDIMPAKKPTATATARPRPKPRPKPKDEPAKFEPKEAKKEKADEKKEFTLPALDL